MQEPKPPELRLGQCVSTSFSAWTHNLPVLFLGTLLALLFSPLFFASIAGLILLTLHGISGERARVRTVLQPLRHPARFLVLSSIGLVGLLVWTFVWFLLAWAVIPEGVLPAPFDVEADGLKTLIGQTVSASIVPQLPAFQNAPNWWLIVNTVLLVASLQVMFAAMAIRWFHVPLLMARDHLPIIDAYVESRNAVMKYGYARHMALLLLTFAAIQAPELLLDGPWLPTICSVMVTPLALGSIASAYQQTIGQERENRVLREQQFVEMRDELQTAHDMQMDLLPDGPPELSGYYLDGLSVPANNVGGDYFAYRWLDEAEQRLAIVVADVSGKAMHAAVTALRFNEILRYECRGRTEPGPILDGLTRSLDGQVDDATFVTCCIAVLDVSTSKVVIANAGHCYPYLISYDTGATRAVEVNGLPLGIPAAIRPDDPYASVTVDLAPGDGLVLYSDGVVEAQNTQGDMFDDDRLTDVIRRTLPAEGVTTSVRTIYRTVDAFMRGAPRTDDLTIVALKRAIDPDTFGRPQDTF